MKTLVAHALAIASALVLVACGIVGNGKPADPPAGGITAVPRDGSVIVSWVPEDGVDYWLDYAASSALTSQNVRDLPAGTIVPHVASPKVVQGLTNGTTYYFTINGRKDGGPGGSDAPVVAATPRPAGNSWTVGPAAGTNDLRGVAFGSQFISVGANGVMFSSPDGATLTALPFVVASDLNAVAYNGSPALYIAVGAAGAVLTSGDGQNWQIQNSGITNNLSGVTSNGSGFIVAVGANGTLITSSGGASWTALSSGTTENLNAVAYGNGRLVAVGAAGVLLTSTDGTTWQLAASGSSLALNGITFGANQFVAVGAAGTVVTSTDGVTWTPQTAIGPGNLSAVAYGTQFVAVGSGGSVFTSTDGITWTARSSGTGSVLNAVASGNKGYSAVGAAGTNLTAY